MLSIRVCDFFSRTRLLAGDLQKVSFSDFEVESAMNGALDMMAEALVRGFSPELERSADLSLSDGRVLLPEGFLAVQSCYGSDGSLLFSDYSGGESGYRIEGDFFVSGVPSVKLFFLKHPGYVSDVCNTGAVSSVDLSFIFLPHLALCACNLLKGNAADALAVCEKCVSDFRWSKRGAVSDPPMWGG